MTKGQQLQMVVMGVLAWLLIAAARRHGGAPALLIVGALAVAPYWLGPIMIWLTNRSRVPQWDIPAVRGLQVVSGDVRPFFEATDGAFADVGFSLVSMLREKNLTPGYISWVALYM